MTTIESIQQLLGVPADGAWGRISQRALDELLRGAPPDVIPDGHTVKATSFADPADIAAYRRAKAAGASETEALRLGDNGIGCWGDDMTGSEPYCALPPEDMIEKCGSIEAARHRPIEVFAHGRSTLCRLGDRMPSRAHITNGAGLDLNPAACRALGLTPPVATDAVWRWV